jgi:hypothetical protein
MDFLPGGTPFPHSYVAYLGTCVCLVAASKLKCMPYCAPPNRGEPGFRQSDNGLTETYASLEQGNFLLQRLHPPAQPDKSGLAILLRCFQVCAWVYGDAEDEARPRRFTAVRTR